jgi:spore germination cell wall hydrolase CwlJ-like protein
MRKHARPRMNLPFAANPSRRLFAGRRAGGLRPMKAPPGKLRSNPRAAHGRARFAPPRIAASKEGDMSLIQRFNALQATRVAAVLVGASLLVMGSGAALQVSGGKAAADAPRAVAMRPAAAARPIAPQHSAAEEARLWNASLPTTISPDPAARPFVLLDGRTIDQLRASDCLTAAIYYEAGDESLEGQRSVAQVVLNRLRHPAFPKTICGVVFQGSERRTGCQFTFTCDGALARAPSAVGWGRARIVADLALAGFVEPRVGRATHYHADYVAPYWSADLTKVATVGRHIFYRWSGHGGLPEAPSETYAGGEGDRGAERMRPELVSRLQVENEGPAPQTAAPAAPAVEAADAPAVVQDVAALVVAADAVALAAPTPGEAYRLRTQARRESRVAMPSNLF